MMSSDNSVVVDDEDSDLEDRMWRSQRFESSRRKINRIVESDDTESSSTEEDDQLDILEQSGRLTPSIAKAIRRSMFNLSLRASESDSEEEKTEPNKINGSGTDKSVDDNKFVEESDDDNFKESALNETNYEPEDSQNKSQNGKHREVDDADSTRSILESSEHDAIDLTQDSDDEDDQLVQKNVNERKKASKSINETLFSSAESSLVESEKSSSAEENERSISHQDESDINSSSVEITTINSSTEVSLNEEEYPEVILMAKEELNGSRLDHKTAQQKAYLTCQLNKLNIDIRNMEGIALNKVKLYHLPDKGAKLLQSIAAHKSERDRVKAKLEKIDEIEGTNHVSPSQNNLSRIKQEILQQNYQSLTPLGSNYQQYSDIKSESPKDHDIQILNQPTLGHTIDGLGKRALKTFENQQTLTVDRLHDLHGSLVTRPTEDEEAPDPRGLRIQLMPHQKHALAWLKWREKQKPCGGVLADDMGLGKTLTMISLIMSTKDDEEEDDDNDGWIHRNRCAKYSGGTLVVCPASLISQWAGEIKNRCKPGLLLVETYHGNNRTNSARTIARNDVVITTYQLLAREFKNGGNNQKMFSIEWKRVILDEAHVIRNHKSQTCEAVCGLHARKRWALTGTPIHNKELDLYSILKFLRCSPFDDIKIWKRWVDNKNAAGHERLATVMKSLMLRRTKQELMLKGQLETLPEKFLEEINITLDHDERVIYQKLLVYSQTLFAQFLSQRAEKEHMFELGAGKFSKPFMETSTISTKFNKAQKELMRQHKEVKSHMILALILRLRQVCCHPSLINAMLDKEDLEQNDLVNETAPGDILSQMNKLKIGDSLDEEDDEGDIGLDERVRENLLISENPVFKPERVSSKFRVLFKLIKEILKKKEKMIIVSQWTSTLQILANHLRNIEGATYKMFTGAVAIKNRQQVVDDFNAPHDDPQILLLSLTAGGVGLNLVGANHLMLIDIHWNPQLESQAQDRIYRFGQKKNVFIYKLICNDTIEERIKNLQERKLSLATNVLGGSGKASSKLTLDDLRSLFNM